ncbi:sushi domain-containing protein 2-like [Glandiceps talaboti]
MVTVTVYPQELYPYGEQFGDSTLPKVNDGASPELSVSLGFPYYGVTYYSLYINTNGLLSFKNAISTYDEANRIPIASQGEGSEYILIALYWSDIDLTLSGNVYYRIDSNQQLLDQITDDINQHFVSERDFVATWALVTTWDKVKYRGSTSTDENTFQVVMTTDGRYSFVIIIYKQLDWSGSEPTDLVYAAQAGFNAGDGTRWYGHPYNLQDGIKTYLVDNSNVNTNGLWIFRVDTNVNESPCTTGLCIYPTFGSMTGGEFISISGPTFEEEDNIICKFGNYPVVNGSYEDTSEVKCATPQFFGVGFVEVSVSRDGGVNFETETGQFYIQNYDRLKFNIRRVDSSSEDWRYAGRLLQIEWDNNEIDETEVTVDVVVYREDGSQGPRWEQVYTIAASTPNDGMHSFTASPQSYVTAGTDYGTIRIYAVNKLDGRVLWTAPHALGYLMESSYQLDPYGWSVEKCSAFYEEDQTLPDFIEGLLPCPCTLQQALVDVGRWQPDNGCSMFRGSTCTYHQGALHCVRAVIPTRLGGGNQCCYDNDGNLMFALDTDQGSTPDRYHTWGSYPYNERGRVPSTSHWLVDVITFYYCCLWSDHCWKYMALRATKDCIDYEPARPATVFGDPHFITLDGLEYSFNDKGEFTLIKTTDDIFELQGRFEQIQDDQGNDVDATVLTAIVLQDNFSDGDKVEVRLSHSTVLELLVNGQTVNIGSQDWLDFYGVALTTPERESGDNITMVTIMLERGIGVDVKAQLDMMTVQFLLPPTLKNIVTGLFGNWNDDVTDDLMTPDGKIIPADSPPEEIFSDFGREWEITNTDMFTYNLGKDHSDYHDDKFVPIFEPPSESELSPELKQQMDEVCQGTVQCEFDVKSTNRIDVGNMTKTAVDSYIATNEGSQKVVACLYIPTPLNGSKTFIDTKTHLMGSKIQFQCDDGCVQTGTPQRECEYNGKWTGDKIVNGCEVTECGTLLPPGHGSIELTVEDDLHVAYFTCEEGYSISGATKRRCVNGVWTGLDTECYEGIDPDLALSLIIGLSCAAGVILIAVILFVIYILYKKHNKEKDEESKSQTKPEMQEVKYDNRAVTIGDEDDPVSMTTESKQHRTVEDNEAENNDMQVPPKEVIL